MTTQRTTRYTASAAVAPPGVDRNAAPHYALNPYVDQLAASDPAAVTAAMAANSTPPTLFAGGDLPAYCASGLDPAGLTAVPWYARHAVAAATTVDDARFLIEFYSGPDGLVHAGETQRHVGNRDYETRIWEWIGAGEEAAEARGRSAEVQPARVGASAALADEAQMFNVWARQFGVDPKELNEQ